MKIQTKGKRLIKESESLKLVAYLCPAGIPTIGYGTTKGVTLEDVKNKRKITKAQAEAFFERDLEVYEKAIYALCTVEPNQNQFDAMVSLTYNIGISAFKTSSVLRLHNKGKFIDASRAFNLFNKARVNNVLTVVRGLVIRRAKESALYLEPTHELKEQQDTLAGEAITVDSIAHDDNNKNNIQYILPQAVQEERPMTQSTITRGSVIAGTTALTAGTLETLNTANLFREQIQNLGEYAVPFLCLVVVFFTAYTLYQRFKQRNEGIA